MLKYCESFDHITAASLAALGWGGDTNRQILVGAGRGGSNLLDLNVTLTYNVGPSHFTLPRSCNRIIVGFAFTRKADYYGNSNFHIQFCYGDYENFRVQVALSASGLTFNLWTGSGTGYPAIPSSAYVSVPFVQTNAFTFVEILVDVADFMNGRVKCGVNGKVVYDQTGIATAAYIGFGSNPFDPRAKINRVQFNHTMRLDSVYICDDEGGYHNDFLSDIFVKTIYPVGDGEQAAWEPYVNGLPVSDGAVRTELIDDPVFSPDSEPDYIQSAQDLAKETMWFPVTAELPASSTIFAVNHRTAARSVASPGTPPPNTLIPLYKSSGNDIVITNSLAKKLIGWTYQFLDVYYNLVPVLTVDWTRLLLEGSQFGFMLREPIWTGVTLEALLWEDLASSIRYFSEIVDEYFEMHDENTDDLWIVSIDETFSMDDGADEGNFPAEDGIGLVEDLSWALFSPMFTGVLLRFEGADGSTTFTDLGGGSWSRSGSAQIDTAQKKFGNASGLFNGSTDYIYANINNCIFGTGDFTVDFWLRRTGSISGYTSILSIGGYSGVYIRFQPGAYLDLAADSGSKVTGGVLSADTWHHVAIVRASGSLKLFLDGTLQGAATVTKNLTSNSVRVGKDPQDPYCFNGWIDELQISQGIARWTTNFTPPDSEIHYGHLIYDGDVTEEQLGIADGVIDE